MPLIQVTDFTRGHIEAALDLARANYEAERACVPDLPPQIPIPDLEPFAQNGMGVAALMDGALAGYLCACAPFARAFRSTDAVGVFSPMHANAVTGTIAARDRAMIYARLYEAAGEKWAGAGATSHAVCVYAHDEAAQTQLFRYGFGMRCVDAMRDVSDPESAHMPDASSGASGVRCVELARGAFARAHPLNALLDAHMARSPTFMLRAGASEAEFVREAAEAEARVFAALDGESVVAFLQARRGGETIACDAPGYMHIAGAYCLPGYRGKGVFGDLLGFTVRALREDGCVRLGVDYESINPAAHGFWQKHFRPYTYGLVRRIDEHALLRFSR